MLHEPSLAIFGATGVLGAEVLSVIEELHEFLGPVSLFASEDSVGEVYRFGAEELVVESIDDGSISAAEIVILAVPLSLGTELLGRLDLKAQWVIDLSGASRAAENGMLYWGGLSRLSKKSERILRSPSPVATMLLPLLSVFSKEEKPESAVVTSFQAVSDVGKAGLDELWEQTRAVFTQKDAPHEVFPYQIAFNCVPQIGSFLSSGATTEEAALIAELQAALGECAPEFSCTCVRVPVFHSHALSVYLKFPSEISIQDIEQRWGALPGLVLRPKDEHPPLPIDCAATDVMVVGRVRANPAAEHSVQLWAVADNLRFGIARNVKMALADLLGLQADERQ